jgi:DUF1680 family protein
LPMSTQAQEVLYPHHFDLNKVTLLDSPMKTAQDLNFKTLLSYDVDRLLTPFVRQAGLTTGTYADWTSKHPNFSNWGGNGFDLSGHVGGHYLSALALAYAACHDTDTRQQLKNRLDYMIGVLKDCQDAFDNDTTGLKGFIGGQPINNVWQKLYQGNISAFSNVRGWVPFYCEHKVMAGLRDAAVYAGDSTAREMFRKLSDWAVDVVAKLSTQQMQSVLDTEHGGMDEVLADAYTLFGDTKYLDAAKKYSHQTMLNGMQTVNTTFLDNLHANTQVPKYIGFERIAEDDATATKYATAARNFWTDVATNRTTCIGGNSVDEHFLSAGNSNRYIDRPDGPESCNSNNMLKLSEMLSDETHDARYADFYEYTMLNHILSTQDPQTGGYVYFTTLRPQGYRIYSQVNQAMWCCVGTGMENHSKYGHFVYTHDGDSVLYVNLFTPSTLNDDRFAVTQTTSYPYSQQSTLTLDKGGTFTLAIRHPWWTTDGYAISVNGEPQQLSVQAGTASYATLTRTWQKGDVVSVTVPMTLRTAECPNYTDYIAFEYGPVLLAAKTTAVDQADADSTGLTLETLQNEYAGEGRMDHAPGSVGKSKQLTTAPLLIGERSNVLSRITDARPDSLRFTIDVSRSGATDYTWTKLTLQPFATIHHARYMCYWYQQTAENYANSDMAKAEREAAELEARTLDFVAPGEQQSEAGHEYSYSSDSGTGSYNDETYRDARANGYIQYSLFNPKGVTDSLSVLCRFTTADQGRKATLTVDGVKIADIVIPSSVKGASNGFYNIEYPIPASLAVDSNGNAKEKFVVRLTASASTLCPGLYYMRLMSGYTANAYKWVASDWKTGDTWRLTAYHITYNATDNTLTVNQTGNNNVCLMLDYTNHDYNISSDQKYLLVIGTNLSTADGMSYLWWLNGKNKGTQVKPTYVSNLGTEQVIAWDMTASGIAENISTSGTTNICSGQTIFGLTSTTGTSVIKRIDFVSNIDKATAINDVTASADKHDVYYDLTGRKVNPNLEHGVYIVNGKKIMK